jgi:carbonic anhydrase
MNLVSRWLTISNAVTRRRLVAGAASTPAALGANHCLRQGEAADYDLEEDPITPDEEGLPLLNDGNQRFMAGELTAFDDLDADRTDVAEGQHPFAVIVNCSDSGVPPEVLFDQSVGQLLVARTA